jgi:hypothetical protein
MTQTPHLALPLLDAAQAQKHVTHNEALSLMDALAHLAASARATAPPPAPNEGDRLLVTAVATGAFAGKEKQIATFLAGAWSFLQPQSGWRLYLAAESQMLLYNGADWVDLASGLRELQNLTRLGVGTTADATNPFAAKINAALFTAKGAAEGGSGDLRLTLNKELAGNTGSILYQSNYSARAEAGLSGNNDFRVKVSADGATWKDAIIVDQATGGVTFPRGGPAKIQTFATSGVYTPAPGMRFVDVVLYGAGGGGGGGGGIAHGRFTSAQIGASRTVTIGAGGAGGVAQTADSASGRNGGAGGNTSLGGLMTAFGGGAGSGGGLATGSGGGGGSGFHTRGGDASGPTGGVGSQAYGSGGSSSGGGGATLVGHGSGGAG